MQLILVLAIPVLLAGLAPFAWRWLGSWWPRLATLGTLVVVGLLLSMLPDAIAGQAQTVAIPWMPRLGLHLALQADGWGLLMALIISGIGAGILCYAGGYLGKDERTGSITAWLLLFMAAMLGVALADNIIFLFVAWEVTSFTSFLLIGTNHREAESRAGARRALLVTAAGGLALLGGMVLLGQAAGSWSLSSMGAVHDHPLALAAFILICAGAFTKSAQWPFCFWLPGAMAAPTPVSAYLHSATMVKAGVFLLARMHPILGELPAWTPTLVAVSVASMVVVILAVLRATDLKALLAYSTIGALAIMVCLIGIGTDKAMTALALFLLAHACYKGPLFMVAGSIDHAVHDRDIRRLGGLIRPMPWTLAAGMLAALSMVGLPPLLGFVAKEYALTAGLGQGLWLMVVLTLLASSFVLVACNVVLIPAFGRHRDHAAHAHESPWSMIVPMLLIAGIGLAAGCTLATSEHWIIAPAVESLGAKPYHLSFWHGFNAPLVASVVAISLGLVAFWQRTWLASVAPVMPSGAAIFDRVWYGILAVGKAVVARLQNGSLSQYVIITVVSACALLVAAFFIHGVSVAPEVSRAIRPFDAVIGLLIMLAAVVTALAGHRLFAIAAMGALGQGVTLFFLSSHAPDLALTQFLVEVLTVVLLVVAFRHLPDFRATPCWRQPGRVSVALLVGICMTVLCLVALGIEPAERISTWHGEQALTGGKGANVVNVILVDFRALDTLGEITVLAIAALGVGVLMGRIMMRREEGGDGA